MAELWNGKPADRKSMQIREKELIDMLVATEFPVRKRSKTSEEILSSIRDLEDAQSGRKRAKNVNKLNGQENQNNDNVTNQGPTELDKTRLNSEKIETEVNVKKKLDRLFQEMDKKTNLCVNSLKTKLSDKTSDNSSTGTSNSRLLRSPTPKVPPLDPRLLTTHSVLTGDLSLGRNFKILGFNGDQLVEDSMLRIGWRTFNYPAASGFYSCFTASDSKRSAGSAFGSPIFADSAPVHLTWADSPAKLKNLVFVEGVEMVNHIPNMALLSDKVKLYESLSTYERQVMGGGMRRPGLGIVGHIKMDRFVPTTFRVDVPTDRTRFYREFRPGQIWICKPANENCGRGIFLVRSVDEFHQLLTAYEELKAKSPQGNCSGPPSQAANSPPTPTPIAYPETQSRDSTTSNSLPNPTSPNIEICSNANANANANASAKVKPVTNLATSNKKAHPAFHNHSYHRVVQRYIENPLLIDGRKADLRAFLLVASTDPYILLFRTGYVRLAMDQYDASGKSPFSHLTNQFVQKKHPEYESKKDDSVMTMEKFNDFVNDRVASEVGVAKDWVKDILPAEMKKIMVQCFQSIRLHLPSVYSNGRFELLGFDFMLDDKLNLWLIEANINPSLATNNQTLARVIPSVVQEALYIAIECFEKQKVIRGPLTPLHTRKNFEFIYEEYSSSKWIFGQNPSPRWSPSFALSEGEKARLSVSRRQALCPRIPLGSSIRGKWAANLEDNSPAAITAIAATKHLVETMRSALEADERDRRGDGKGEEVEEEDKTGEEEEEEKREDIEDNGTEKTREEAENGKSWLRERWH